MNNKNKRPNDNIPTSVILKYIVSERDKWKGMYYFAKDKCIKSEKELKGLQKQITRYQQARNEEGKFISQEQYNAVRKRNKKLSGEVAKLRAENSEMIYKVMRAEQKLVKPKTILERVKYVIEK
jgi:hypothetical protein